MRRTLVKFKMVLMLLTSIALIPLARGQSGNYVSSGAEATNFGTISLNTPVGKTWLTARTATPGYFSAYYPNAQYINYNDFNNVDGYVKKYGNEPFVFPVGTGADLRLLSIAAPAATSDAYATAWILGHPGSTPDPTSSNAMHDTAAVAGVIKKVMPIGQWDWQAISGTGANLPVSVSMPNLNSFAPKGHLRLVGWDPTVSKWVALGTVAPNDNKEDTLISGTMRAGIDAISIGSIAAGLPDLTPTTKITNGTFTITALTQRDLVVDISEILGNITDASTMPIKIRVSKSNNLDYTFDASITSVMAPLATAVQNNLFTVETNTSSAITLKLNPGVDINALSKLSFSIRLKVKSTAAPATINVNVGVFEGAGAETIFPNNYVIRVLNII
jgi:hypothetical protein